MSPSLKVLAAGRADIGRGRVHNDDTVLLRPELYLFAVADGAGRGGHVASAVASSSVANYFESTERGVSDKPDVDGFGLYIGARRVASAIHQANRDIANLAKGSNEHRRMGATIVCAAISPSVGLLHLGNAGDSRGYRLRAGRLEQLTEDHSLINDAIALRPDIDEEELARLPRNVVTRVLGVTEGFRVNARTHEIAPGDRYLLCSDGLSDVVSDDTIRDVLSQKDLPEEMVRHYIRLATEAGSEDNVAAIVLFCELPIGTTFVPVRRAPMFSRHVTPLGAPLDRMTNLPESSQRPEVSPPPFSTADDEPTRRGSLGGTAVLAPRPIHEPVGQPRQTNTVRLPPPPNAAPPPWPKKR